MGAKYPNLETVTYAFDGSIRVDLDDLMYLDGNDAKPASSQADKLTEEKNQRCFARNFCGVAKERKLAAETASGQSIDVVPDWVGVMACASSAFEVGDMLAIDEASSGTALERQTLVKTTDRELAIGYCVKREASAVTSVLCRLLANKTPYRAGGRALGFPRGAGINTETLAGTKTLDVNDAPVHALDPGGAGRTVLLPPEADSVDLHFIIRNTADAAEVLTIKEDSDTTAICTPTQNESAIVWCDGTTWRGITGFHN